MYLKGKVCAKEDNIIPNSVASSDEAAPVCVPKVSITLTQAYLNPK